MSEAQHKANCLARWREKADEARRMVSRLRRKDITRTEINQWIESQAEYDRVALRKVINDALGVE